MLNLHTTTAVSHLRTLVRQVAPYMAILLVAFGIIYIGNKRISVLPTGDEVHVLVASWSLAKDGDFNLKNQYDSDFLFARLPDRAIVTYGDKQYPVLGLGESMLYWLPAKLAVPSGDPATFFRYVRIQMNLLWSLAAVLLFYSLCQLTSDRILSSLCAIGLVATFPGILYASSAQADSMGGVLFTFCLAASLTLNPRRFYLAFILGLLSGLLMWVHPRFAPIVLMIAGVLFGYSLWAGTVRIALIAFLLPFASLVGALVMVNFAVYPEPSFWMALFGPTGPHFRKIASLKLGLTSLPHTLFDGWHGLVPVFPLSIASLIGLVRNRQHRLISLVVVLLIIAYLVIDGSNPDALGNGFYLGGRYHIVFLGCLWWGLGLYLSQLRAEWHGSKARQARLFFIMPFLALGLMLAATWVSSYYAYRTDEFSASGASYGPWSSLFPMYFISPNSGFNHLKALYLCALSLMIGSMLLRAGRAACVASMIVYLSLLMYVAVAHSDIQRERSNFREVVDFNKHVLQTIPNAGKFSADFYVKLAGEGYYTVKFYVNAGNLNLVTPGTYVGQCDANHYLGRNFSVYPGVPMIAGYSLKEGLNVLIFNFYYEGVGPVFLRGYIGVPGVKIEMQNAVVELSR